MSNLSALYRFDKPCCALASSHAHSDHRIAATTALELAQSVTYHARTGHTEGMADGDATAIDVVLRILNTQRIAAVNAL